MSPLPGTPNAVFTVRKRSGGRARRLHRRLFRRRHARAAVGDTVEEVSDSGFLGTVPTLSASLLGDDSLLQVHPGGLRHVRADGRVNEWRTPGRKTVTRATVNRRQAAIALFRRRARVLRARSDGSADGDGEARDERRRGVPAHRSGAGRAAQEHVSGCGVVRLDGSYPLPRRRRLPADHGRAGARRRALLAAPAHHAVRRRLPQRRSRQRRLAARGRGQSHRSSSATSALSFSGARPPALFPTTTRGAPAILALSSRPWLGHVDLEGRFTLSPLSYDALEHAAPFSPANSAPRGSSPPGNTLRVVAVERLGENFNQTTRKLRYTPRELSVNPDRRLVAVVEADQSCVPYDERPGQRDPRGGGDG